MKKFFVQTTDEGGNCNGLLSQNSNKSFETTSFEEAERVFNQEESYLKENYELSDSFDKNYLSCTITSIVDRDDMSADIVKMGERYEYR